MVRYKISFTILISQAVLYQENISKEAIAKDLEIDENIFEDDK